MSKQRKYSSPQKHNTATSAEKRDAKKAAVLGEEKKNISLPLLIATCGLLIAVGIIVYAIQQTLIAPSVATQCSYCDSSSSQSGERFTKRA